MSCVLVVGPAPEVSELSALLRERGHDACSLDDVVANPKRFQPQSAILCGALDSRNGASAAAHEDGKSDIDLDSSRRDLNDALRLVGARELAGATPTGGQGVSSTESRPPKSGLGFRLPATGIDLAELEREVLIQALQIARNNQTRAAALLGITRDQIRYRMAKFGLATRESSAPTSSQSVKTAVVPFSAKPSGRTA